MTLLANPDFAILLMLAGGLLICLECNLPGTIIPGAVGTLCLLIGAFSLSRLPLRPFSVVLLVAFVALIFLETRIATYGIFAIIGSCSLSFGLSTLLNNPTTTQHIHLAVAIPAGIVFGIVSFSLASIARRARCNKIRNDPNDTLWGEPE